MNPVAPINSGEEFSFEDIDGDVPSTAGSDGLQELEPQDDDSPQDDNSRHTGSSSAFDIPHFFVTIDGPVTRKGQMLVKVCKICL